MIGYVTVGTNNLGAATQFFDELFGSIGAGRTLEGDTFVSWSTGPEAAGIAVTLPFDGESATIGNGSMIAISLDAPAKVDALHAKALALGGADEGAPGIRFENFYAAYFRDLDGNKFSAFCIASD